MSSHQQKVAAYLLMLLKKEGLITNISIRKILGLVKPDIVFFGEALPERFFLYYDDVLLTDCLIVIGTSLEVYPFAIIADEVPSSTPRLLINRDVVGSFGTRKNDILQSDKIEGVNEFSTKLGWKEDLKNLFEKCET